MSQSGNVGLCFCGTAVVTSTQPPLAPPPDRRGCYSMRGYKRSGIYLLCQCKETICSYKMVELGFSYLPSTGSHAGACALWLTAKRSPESSQYPAYHSYGFR